MVCSTIALGKALTSPAIQSGCKRSLHAMLSPSCAPFEEASATVGRLHSDLYRPVVKRHRRTAGRIDRPRVRFAPSEQTKIINIERASSMTEAERDSVWYGRSEYDSFAAKALLLVHRLAPLGENDSLRGFERQLCSERRRNRQLARLLVLEAQRLLGARSSAAIPAVDAPLRLAVISSKCTLRAREAAQQIAFDDYVDAYL